MCGDIQIAAGQIAQSVEGAKSSRSSVRLVVAGAKSFVWNDLSSVVRVIFNLRLIGWLIESEALLQAPEAEFPIHVAGFDANISNKYYGTASIAAVFHTYFG